MIYYRVNKNGADKYIFNCKICLLKNEIYTEKEREKYNIPFSYVEKVNISKKNIYWFFGARFECGYFIDN